MKERLGVVFTSNTINSEEEKKELVIFTDVYNYIKEYLDTDRSKKLKMYFVLMLFSSLLFSYYSWNELGLMMYIKPPVFKITIFSLFSAYGFVLVIDFIVTHLTKNGQLKKLELQLNHYVLLKYGIEGYNYKIAKKMSAKMFSALYTKITIVELLESIYRVQLGNQLSKGEKVYEG